VGIKPASDKHNRTRDIDTWRGNSSVVHHPFCNIRLGVVIPQSWFINPVSEISVRRTVSIVSSNLGQDLKGGTKKQLPFVVVLVM